MPASIFDVRLGAEVFWEKLPNDPGFFSASIFICVNLIVDCVPALAI